MGRLWLSFPQFVTNHLKNLYLRFKWVLTWIPDMLRLKIGNALFLYNTTTNHFHNIKYPSCYRYASLVDELLKVLWQHKHAHCTLLTIERSRNCLFVCLILYYTTVLLIWRMAGWKCGEVNSPLYLHMPLCKCQRGLLGIVIHV